MRKKKKKKIKKIKKINLENIANDIYDILGELELLNGHCDKVGAKKTKVIINRLSCMFFDINKFQEKLKKGSLDLFCIITGGC